MLEQYVKQLGDEGYEVRMSYHGVNHYFEIIVKKGDKHVRNTLDDNIFFSDDAEMIIGKEINRLVGELDERKEA